MTDFCNPTSSVTTLITALGSNFSKSNIEAVLFPNFTGLNSTNQSDAQKINCIAGSFFSTLKTQMKVTDALVISVMEDLFNSLAQSAPSIINITTFYAYFCHYYSPGCLCFESIILKILHARHFNLDLKSPQGLQNFGTALGLYAKVAHLSLEQCLKPHLHMKGILMAYAMTEYFSLVQDDFLLSAGYPHLDLKFKKVGGFIRKLIDLKMLNKLPESLSAFFSELLVAWQEAGFVFSAKILADFLIIHTQVSRKDFEAIKNLVYNSLSIPAVQNVYLKIQAFAEIDLSTLVDNDNTAFQYTLDTSDTKGQMMLSPHHPPVAPLVRYKLPEYAENSDVFRDVFSFTVKNLSNDYESTAFVFLLYSCEQASPLPSFSPRPLLKDNSII